MTPDPQTTPPAEPMYSHEETGLALHNIELLRKGTWVYETDFTATCRQIAAQLARADERVKELENERDRLTRENGKLRDSNAGLVAACGSLEQDNFAMSAALTRKEE